MGRAVSRDRILSLLRQHLKDERIKGSIEKVNVDRLLFWINGFIDEPLTHEFAGDVRSIETNVLRERDSLIAVIPTLRERAKFHACVVDLGADSLGHSDAQLSKILSSIEVIQNEIDFLENVKVKRTGPAREPWYFMATRLAFETREVLREIGYAYELYAFGSPGGPVVGLVAAMLEFIPNTKHPGEDRIAAVLHEWSKRGARL